jgi:hypothetical protein
VKVIGPRGAVRGPEKLGKGRVTKETSGRLKSIPVQGLRHAAKEPEGVGAIQGKPIGIPMREAVCREALFQKGDDFILGYSQGDLLGLVSPVQFPQDLESLGGLIRRAIQDREDSIGNP